MNAKGEVKLSAKQNRLMAIKYFFFSVSAGIVEAGSYAILSEFTKIDSLAGLKEIFGNEYGLNYFIALTLSVIWNFTLNRKFTFKSAANVPIAMLKVLAFYLVFAPLSIWWTAELTGIGWNNYLVLALTMIVNFVTEFLYWRFVVYRKQIYTNEAGRRELAEEKKAQR